VYSKVTRGDGTAAAYAATVLSFPCECLCRSPVHGSSMVLWPLLGPATGLISHNHSTVLYTVLCAGPLCTWYRPTSLTQLLSLKAAVPELKLVGGNSEVSNEPCRPFSGAQQLEVVTTDPVNDSTELSRH
jgi:hypothetical protein